VNHKTYIENKILNLEQLLPKLSIWRMKQEKIVFTNGCFDLLHYGHIDYLSKAADLGNKLIIGLNSDDSIHRLKGKHRPIKDQKSREIILAALHFVDIVIVFNQDTPLKLIQSIQPNFLVKGGDWKPEQIVGSEDVIKNGGKVMSIPFVNGYSTTNLERKILSSNGQN
jgi:rfaE bifunctional protein nucleotidyltransferase chain/domain